MTVAKRVIINQTVKVNVHSTVMDHAVNRMGNVRLVIQDIMDKYVMLPVLVIVQIPTVTKLMDHVQESVKLDGMGVIVMCHAP